MNELVGRDAEREAVDAVLAAGSSAPAQLVIDGEAGIGKTTICGYAIERAAAAGVMALACTPTEAEAALSFAALTDLLAGVSAEVFDALPAPQRHALEVATLRDTAAGGPLDGRSVGTGLASLLTSVCEDRGLVLLVDDAQWLDQATLDALVFALRRLGDIPVTLVISSRPASSKAADLADAMISPTLKRQMDVAGLSEESLFEIVRLQLGIVLSHPALVRVAELSRGNPFLAVEVARSGGNVTRRVSSLSTERLAKLSGEACEALLAIACSPRPTLQLLDALGLRVPFDEAEAAGVVELIGGRVEFVHPLLSSAAVSLATPAAQRRMHGRLAALSPSPEANAHHLALATPEPDERVAAALSAAVESSAGRGASAAALELARLALSRTVDPTGPAGWERRIRLAEILYLSGDTNETLALLADLSSCPPGPARARAWLQLAQLEWNNSTPSRAHAAALHAFEDADDDDEIRVQALLQLAAFSRSADERVERTAAARAIMDAAGIADPQLHAWALCEDVQARFHSGHGLDRAALDRAFALERTVPFADGQTGAVRPFLLAHADASAEALAGFQDLRQRAELEGNEGLVPYALSHIPGCLIRQGRFLEARAAAQEHLFRSEASGQIQQRLQAVMNLSLANIYLGNMQDATRGAEALLAWAQEHEGQMEGAARRILAFAALSVGDFPGARTWYERYEATLEPSRSVDPGVDRYDGDLIETLIATGALDDAASRTESLHCRAERSGRISAAATAERCRGLLDAAHGDQESALVHLDAALVLHGQIDAPFEAARTRMTKGIVHRRAKEKRLATTALAGARESFVAMSASPWASRAEVELQRVGLRAAGPLELTVTERRIAELVATGLTNRQVAQQAFISAKTVEANLAKIYRKLGISSRAQLGAHMATGPE